MQGFTDVHYIGESEHFTFNTDKAEKLSMKAFDLKKTKDYDKAIQLYREAIQIEPDNPKLFFDLSDCYSKLNRLEQAISLLDTAIILDSSYAPFYKNRGLYYGNLNNSQKARIDFKKAIELDSSNFVIYANIALSYYYDKDSISACEAFRTSKSLGLTISSLNSNIGLRELNIICK